MLKTEIVFFGKTCLAVCDHRCEKAWGINGRHHFEAQVAFDDEDDYANLADHELGDAPLDPGTYEGTDAKPFHPIRHNKWCVRECERSSLIEPGCEIVLNDYSKRVYNIPNLHPDEDHSKFHTGEIYTVGNAMTELTIVDQIIAHCRQWVVENHMSFMTDEYKAEFLAGKHDENDRFLRAIQSGLPLGKN